MTPCLEGLTETLVVLQEGSRTGVENLVEEENGVLVDRELVQERIVEMVCKGWWDSHLCDPWVTLVTLSLLT